MTIGINDAIKAKKIRKNPPSSQEWLSLECGITDYINVFQFFCISQFFDSEHGLALWSDETRSITKNNHIEFAKAREIILS